MACLSSRRLVGGLGVVVALSLCACEGRERSTGWAWTGPGAGAGRSSVPPPSSPEDWMVADGEYAGRLGPVEFVARTPQLGGALDDQSINVTMIDAGPGWGTMFILDLLGSVDELTPGRHEPSLPGDALVVGCSGDGGGYDWEGNAVDVDLDVDRLDSHDDGVDEEIHVDFTVTFAGGEGEVDGFFWLSPR